MTAIVFEEHRGWNAGVGELPLIGLIIGAALGSLIILWDTTVQGKKMKRGEKITPEQRLRTALFGGPTLAVAMFWFSWSANYNYVHWIVPSIAGVFLAAAMLCIFVPFLNCTFFCYPMQSPLPSFFLVLFCCPQKPCQKISNILKLCW